MAERLVPPSETINANGITLRRWRRGDAAPLTKAVRESLAHLQPWMPWAAGGYGRAESVEFLDRCETGWRDGTEFNYGIYGGGRRVIGSAGLMTRVGPGILEIGYWVHVDHTRRGVATRAAAALAAAGLAVPGIDLIEIHHQPANTASGAVAARLGFTRAGERPVVDGVAVVWQLHAGELPGSFVPDVLGQPRY